MQGRPAPSASETRLLGPGLVWSDHVSSRAGGGAAAAAEDRSRSDQVAQAVADKLAGRGYSENPGVVAADEFVACNGHAIALAMREQVARRLFGNAVRLSELRRSQDAIVAY